VASQVFAKAVHLGSLWGAARLVSELGQRHRVGARGPLLLSAAGVTAFLLAYLLFATAGPTIALLAVAFVLAGVGIGCVETAEHAAVAALAPVELRGSSFGLLATMQAVGNLTASAIAGLLYTLASPAVAFGYLAAWMLIALVLLIRPLTATAQLG
jgi:MFS family permease